MYEPFPEGHIEVISGCMFAGKTEELLHRLRRAEIAGHSVSVFTPSVDDRYGEEQIGSHNNVTRTAITIDPVTESDTIIEQSEGASVVGIDEGNFFNEDIIPVVNELADMGKRVIISGLDQTFRGEPFEPMNDLLSIADSVEKLVAVCTQCGRQATRNQRLLDGEPAPKSSPTIQVGGEETYEARCRHCHELPQE